MLLESRFAAQTADLVKVAHENELKTAAERSAQERLLAEKEKQKFTESLEKERDEHAKDNRSKDRNLAAASSHATGLRNALEAELTAARTSGTACTSRIAGISEALGGLFESIGEVTGIAQDLGRENQQLKEDNHALSDKLTGWQKWNSERMQRIIINGKKVD
jgi:hypothetical protein